MNRTGRFGKQLKAETYSAMCHETNEACSSNNGFWWSQKYWLLYLSLPGCCDL